MQEHTVPSESIRQKLPLNLLMIFLVLAAGIMVSGYLYYAQQEEQLKKEAGNNISSIAELKTKEIMRWKRGRMGDASVFVENPLIKEAMSKISDGKNGRETRQALLSAMESLRKHSEYENIYLLDIKGNPVVSTSDSREKIGEYARELAIESMHSRQLIFSDLHRGKDVKHIHIGMVAPVIAYKGKAVQVYGAFLFRIDPSKFLFPLIQSWPVPSQTAETLLVRKEGNDVLFLNELRHRKDTALNLRIPLNGKELPAAMAIRGVEGVVEGKDYRNIPVFAAIRAIPETPWFIVSKIDKQEVLAPLEKRAFLIAIIVSILVLASGLGILLTWRHQSAESYRGLNEELEQRVRERTAQLKAVNEELEAFAYSVSHDLRAPLRAIDGFSRFVLEDYAGKLDDEGKRLLNVIRTNTQKMDRLITELLGLSRVSRTEMKLSFIDMTTLANSAYKESASPEIQENFILSIAPLPDAFGDPILISQVWGNLISNAVKYTMPKEERRIEIGGQVEDGMNVYYVKDTGVGFNPDYAHKLFGLFQRLHSEAEFEGTGVGLAIVQRIINRHGGKVWAEGKLNEGATFWFTIPKQMTK
jgi:signal transduction histidine kinase